jgi:hypothetical protein
MRALIILLALAVLAGIPQAVLADEEEIVQAEMERLSARDIGLKKTSFYVSVGGRYTYTPNERYNDDLRVAFDEYFGAANFEKVEAFGGLELAIGAGIERHNGELRYTYTIPHVSRNQYTVTYPDGETVEPYNVQVRIKGWSLAGIYRYYLYGSPTERAHRKFSLSAGGGIGFYHVSLDLMDGAPHLPTDTSTFVQTEPVTSSNVGFSAIVSGEYSPMGRLSFVLEAEYLAARFKKLSWKHSYTLDCGATYEYEYIYQYPDGTNIQYEITGPAVRLSIRYYVF